MASVTYETGDIFKVHIYYIPKVDLIFVCLQDFKQRVKAYESVYETIEDNEDGGDIQYIKLYNVGQKVVTRNCKGYLPSQVAFYLQVMSVYTCYTSIYVYVTLYDAG